ncbi:MAG: sulfotransferase, partial [Proteobacteria bacterium]|nr:sulfotransferase [Pseudomonadota bacterium]
DIFGRAFVKFHEAAARQAGKARWADKNPENVFYLEQWQSLLPKGFLFVHVVRDPLDALASLLEIGFAKAVPADFEDKVRLLRSFRDAGARYCVGAPSSSVEVRYEDLVTSPTDTMRSLMEQLGEVFEPAMLGTVASPERGSGIEDPKARHHAGINAESVGRGRRDLSAHQVDLATRYLGEYL